ncbi:pyridoxal phosphate-dependent transferase [Elsinoe ampelina]|uniref:Pyridoxal phosphate-dependent transferase n=1 Tax=Elsinoe ampelina TaxID=302913 RepID=A0A6A6GAB0_9PEZI|nr:pyridoxal phosphate-dependent transferase [Elsinoe ampelina]
MSTFVFRSRPAISHISTAVRKSLAGNLSLHRCTGTMSSQLKANGMSNGHMASVLDERPVPPLGMVSGDFEQRAADVVKDIANYYDTLHDRPVLPSIQPGYLQKLLPTSAPEEPESWSSIRSDIESKIMPGITHWQSQKYMAFFPASSTYPSILAEMWSAALTAANFNWICSPAVTELENVVMDWMAKALHLPSQFLSNGTGGGVIQGSASEAVATVMIAARERYLKTLTADKTFSSDEEREDFEFTMRGKMVALSSSETHSSAKKAATITGVRFRSIPATAEHNFSLQASSVRSTLESLTAPGLHPFQLTVTLGTTNTCAIDDFAAIAALKADYPNLWIHVDAAYAGAALILPEFAHLTQHFPSFDSFDMNMHKWLLVNFDCSLLYVQNRRDLTDALSVTPAYLRNAYTDSGLVTDYRDWQIPLGRRFRALKIWFVARTYGLKGMREHIRHHLRLGDLFASLVRSRQDLFAILTPPAFALTVLTVKPSEKARVEVQNGEADPRPYEESEKLGVEGDEGVKEANEVTKEVYEVIDGEKEIFLTASVIGGVYAIRVVSANPLAEEKYVRRAFDVLVEATERVLEKRRKA